MGQPHPLLDHIRAIEEASSAPALLQATRALADLISNTAPKGEVPWDPGDLEAAIACLVQVLGFNNPGAAVAAVDGLINLGPMAVDPLLARLDPRNYGARAWAVRALAGIGDVRGLTLLEEALATDVGPSVRRAAAHGLGRLQLASVEPDERQDIRARALASLVAGCGDGEWVVRYAVAVGLESLVEAMEPLPQERQQALEALEALALPEREETPVVRLRAAFAQRRLLGSPAIPICP